MEITYHTRDTLILEDKRALARVFILAFAGAGILLTLSSIQEYGFQAWYRLTHWGGALMAISGALIYLRTTFIRRVQVSALHNEVIISTLRGFSWTDNESFEATSVKELTIERRAIGPKELFRLVMVTDHGKVSVQRGFSQDFIQVEQAAKSLQTMLG